MDDNPRFGMLAIHFCMTTEPAWDLLRTFEAVARHASLTAAGKALGLSQSTVSRHLARLEESAAGPLFHRETPVRLTEQGEGLLAAIAPMVDAARAASAALENTSSLQGEVVLTTVPEMSRWVLARRLGDFGRRYPGLRLQILANNEVESLAGGRADIALRMVRPARGDLVARRLLTETFGFYGKASLPDGPEVPWLGLTGSLARIAEQRHAARAFVSRPPRALLEDLESLALAVQSGAGVGVLPTTFAERLGDLVEKRPEEIGALDLGPIASRDLWMVVHRGKQHVPRVRAVMDWLGEVFAGLSGTD